MTKEENNSKDQKRIASLETHISLLQTEISDLKHELQLKELQLKELESKLAPFDK